ncbi:MAG: aldo/keto reductase [Lachnospiraceae bacterium]|nr:aldo/keto reductase [Lachnospiraceae bacterium]
MNIGLFTDTYYPELNGVANSVYLLKQELEKRGHNVYVITTKTPGVIDEDDRVFRVPSKAAPMVPERRIGMPYHPKIALKIHKMKLDIIHTNTEFGIGLFGRIMARELFIPVVHTYHTIYEDYTHYLKKYISSEKRAKQFARTYSKFSVRGAEELIVPTEKVATLMRHYGVKPDINIIPTGIDLTKFQEWDTDEEREKLKRSLGIPKGNKVVLSLGRVSEEKNIDEVMEYLDIYMEKHNDVTFLIVGDGPYKGALERKAKGLKHKKSMIFAGAKPWDEINHYYQLGDVFVSASTSETQGLTYIEALASGVALVVRKDDCLDGVLLNGENGYEYEDVDSFAKGMDAVLYNGTGIDYRTNAINSVLKFSTEEFAAKVENIYYHVIKNHRNILMRMANKVAGKIGFVRTGTKPLGGQMAMRLGNSDMDASRFALSCKNFDKLSYHEALRVVDCALESGITMFDNSPSYGDGRCEEIFGQILSDNKGMRQRMRIQTECGNHKGYYDLSKAYMVSSVDDSLKRLNVDCIDLLMLGKSDYLMDPDEIADTISYLQKSGKVRQFGVSGFSIDQMKLLQASCKDSILLERLSCGLSTETDINKTMEIVDFCKLQDITVQAVDTIVKEDRQHMLEVLNKIAKEYGVSGEVVALAWVLRNPANMQIMIEANSAEHVKEMCSAMNIKLTRKEWYDLFFTFDNNHARLDKAN